MQEVLRVIISSGELQVSIGNIYLGIYAKWLDGVAEPQQIKPNIASLWIGPLAACLFLALVLSIALFQV